jgi:hypothetical protein
MTRPTYLYHYTKAETLLKHILPSGTIRLGPFADTNDPRESKEWTFALGSAVRWNGREETTEETLATKMAAILRTTTKVLCLCTDDDRRTGYNTEELHYWGFCRPRMWAQYGDKHKGVCLVLGYRELNDAMEAELGKKGLLRQGQVAYRNWSWSGNLRNSAFVISADLARQEGPMIAVRAHLQHHWRDLFFEKAEDWRDEHEYRWIFTDEKPNPVFVPIRNAIKAVILGSDFQQDQWGDPYHFKKNYGLESKRLSWHNGVPIMLPPFAGPWT